ncbi:hypothetical protein WJX72_012018 [[Myrmecia] bisecta]|uniref:Beta-carotene isomerase D27-like C-terminal domain-containing protein n=1 Tax=[Myrmecia] bisecta TaxID=41462 RepID=A0AAW1QT11_9CHLO
MAVPEKSAEKGSLRTPAKPAPAKPAHAVKDPFAVKEVYHDNAAERAMANFFAGKMAQQLGVPLSDYPPGYDGFVELSTLMMKGRSSKQQQAVVMGVLKSLLPEQGPGVFRRLFPFTKWSAEANARLTTMFFSWLVGPMELKEVEIEYKGQKETWKSGVLIKKCRYLEASGCVGMCTNMCKIPTQDFFTKDFGLPLTMDPNFEDLSCEMIYGRPPPPIEQDKMYGQPCFIQECALGNDTARPPCPKVDTDRTRKRL